MSFLSYLTLSQTGVTALYIAAQNGHLEVVKLLLDKGGDVNQADKVLKECVCVIVCCFTTILGLLSLTKRKRR